MAEEPPLEQAVPRLLAQRPVAVDGRHVEYIEVVVSSVSRPLRDEREVEV